MKKLKYFFSKMANKNSIILHNKTVDMWELGNGQTKNNLKWISWNVNGLRSILKKNKLVQLMNKEQPDFICLNQTKVDLLAFKKEKLHNKFSQYSQYWNFCKVSSGYSGTCVFSKYKPLNIFQDFQLLHPNEYSIQYSLEGRLITLEFDKFYLVNVYKPNVGSQLERLKFRNQYERIFLSYIKKLKQIKNVIICGDMNVAHNSIDLARPKENVGSAGFTYEERNCFQLMLKSGYIDIYRTLYPDRQQFTWWSNRQKSRENNVGWRIDYFLLSDNLKYNEVDTKIHSKVQGSDHCPIELKLKFNI